MSNFLHRFYPLQRLKLARRAIKSTGSITSPLSKAQAPKQVEVLFDALDNNTGFDFSVHRQPSIIPQAGLGVYLKGQCQKGQVVCFYPGTIYLPAEPILFASIANQYILKCVDGLYVDAKTSGLSARIYRSIYYRENWPGAIQTSDITWLKPDQPLKNPFGIGQFVNNGTSKHNANVCYQEVDLPIEFPHQLRQYIPNMYWNQHVNVMKTSMRVVALVSLREIENEELFSTYMDLIE